MSLAFWTDIAVIFLAIETTVLLTVLVVAFYFIVRGLNAVHVRLPNLFSRAQDLSGRVRTKTEDVSTQVGAPLVASQRLAAKAEATAQALLRDAPQKR